MHTCTRKRADRRARSLAYQGVVLACAGQAELAAVDGLERAAANELEDGDVTAADELAELGLPLLDGLAQRDVGGEPVVGQDAAVQRARDGPAACALGGKPAGPRRRRTPCENTRACPRSRGVGLQGCCSCTLRDKRPAC